MNKVIVFLIKLVLALILALSLASFFFLDWFCVKGKSMNPTFVQGEHIFINKTLIGPRIYSYFNPISLESKSVRLPGIRKLQVGDIVAFNYPYGEDGESSDGCVLVKRCAAVSGDTITISKGYYHNCHASYIGVPQAIQQNLSLASINSDISRDAVRAFAFARNVVDWTILDFGPLYVPGKGDEILFDEVNLSLYGRLVKYETGEDPKIGSRYCFKYNYAFLVGDNVFDSYDSRYIGLIPECFIIGIVI